MKTRREILTTGVLGAGARALGSGTSAVAQQTPPPAPGQVPGVYRTRVGEIELIALSDGYFDLAYDLMLNADQAEFGRLLQQDFRPEGPTVRGGVNAYVIRTGGETMLVDTGGRDIFGPSMGRLPLALDAAGVAAQDIGTVVLTHMHPDHLGGLTSADGQAMFPEAELAVHEADWSFWAEPGSRSMIPEPMKFALDVSLAAVDPYRDRLALFTDGKELAPGVRTLHLPGHTAGHSGILLESGDASALIWGDIVHSALMQTAHPDWAVVFDADPAQAALTRRGALDRAATDRLRIAGMHIGFPSLGHIERQGDAYRFVQEPWDYLG